MELDIKRVSKSPVHTAEHILNRTMVNRFECPTDDQVKAIEAKVNEVIAAVLPVTVEYMSREEAASSATTSMTGSGG